MDNNSTSTNLVIGLVAFGLTLVVVGVQIYRRGRAKGTAVSGEVEDPKDTKASNADEPISGGETQDNTSRRISSRDAQEKLPLDYFALVTALTIPFWLFGGKPLPVPVKLPYSALALVNPLIAALILTFRREGWAGVKDLFKRVLDYRKIKHKIWYLPILFLYPVIGVLAYAVMRLARLPLPDPQIPWIMAPVYLVVFFIAGIGEELGWMGYAIDPMQNRWGALKASLLLGLFWAVYHLIPDMQNQQPADWILWHRLGTISFRILMVWVYNNTGKSVFSSLIFHATNNLSWALFPNNGSHYDPFILFILSLPVVAFVIFGWDPKTFTRPWQAKGSQM